MTLNLQLPRNEIHHRFTSHLLQSNNDTLQHRALNDSRISGLWPISVSLLPPSRRLHSLLKYASRSSTFILAVHLELILICVMHEIFLYQFEFSFQSHMQAFQFETSYIHKLMSHLLLSCLLHLLITIYDKFFQTWDYAQAYHVSFTKPLLVAMNPIISRTSRSKY